MKKDFLLLLAILLFALSTLCALYIYRDAYPAEVVVVQVDGKEYARLPLNHDITLDIEGYNGGSNRLVILDGQAFVESASCPDKICVKTGCANEVNSIACLPNRVLIFVETRK